MGLDSKRNNVWLRLHNSGKKTSPRNACAASVPGVCQGFAAWQHKEHRGPALLSAQQAAVGLGPPCTSWVGVVPPQRHFALLSCVRFCHPFSACPAPSAQPLVYHCSSQLCAVCRTAWAARCPYVRVIRTWNRVGLRAAPVVTPAEPSMQLAISPHHCPAQFASEDATVRAWQNSNQPLLLCLHPQPPPSTGSQALPSHSPP